MCNISSLEKKLVQDPNNLDALYKVGVGYLEIGRHVDALKCLLRLVDLEPEQTEHYCTIGWTYLHTGDFENALISYSHALTISPGLILAHSGKVDALYRLGSIDAAFSEIKNLLFSDSSEIGVKNFTTLQADNCIAALRVYTKICTRYEHADQCINVIESILVNTKLNKETYIALSYALADLLDKEKLYSNAFKYYQQANSAITSVYSHAAECNRNDALISAFTTGKSPDTKITTKSSFKPIFILGMPRSGTSLTEQILSIHPDVFAAGELIAVTEIANVLSNQCQYPHTLDNLSNHVLSQAFAHYDNTVNSLNVDNKKFVTDKMPANYMHLGLIKLLFSDAIIINVQRNPLDICLSIFFQRFTSAHGYSFKLQSIAQYYLEYDRLMQHWKNVLGDNIHDLYYEQLIMEQEVVSRSLLNSCGIDWDDKCLDFHQSNRIVVTASQQQVNKKLYQSSLKRWQSYESEIPQEVKDLLHNKQEEYQSNLKKVMSDNAFDKFMS